MGNEANVKWSVQAEKKKEKKQTERQFQEQNGHHFLNSHGVWFSFVINFESGVWLVGYTGSGSQGLISFLVELQEEKVMVQSC